MERKIKQLGRTLKEIEDEKKRLEAIQMERRRPVADRFDRDELKRKLNNMLGVSTEDSHDDEAAAESDQMVRRRPGVERYDRDEFHAVPGIQPMTSTNCNRYCL